LPQVGHLHEISLLFHLAMKLPSCYATQFKVFVRMLCAEENTRTSTWQTACKIARI